MTEQEDIWVAQQGEKFGPYSKSALRELIRDGRFTRRAVVWREGMGEWVAISVMFPDEAYVPSLPPTFAVASGSAAQRMQAAQDDRAGVPRPPSLHWGLLFLFSVLTLGLFLLVWMFIQASWVRKIDPQSKARLMLGLGLTMYFVGYILLNTGAVKLGGLLCLSWSVICVVAYFSMAGSIRRQLVPRGLPVAIGGVTLFFFNIIYLQGQLTWIARWTDTGQTQPPAPKAALWWLMLIPIVMVAMLAGIAVPAYQQYVIRTQVAQGFSVANDAKAEVSAYYVSHRRMPPDNRSLGMRAEGITNSHFVSRAFVDDGSITVAFNTPQASPKIRSDVLVLTPAVTGNQLRWDCATNTTLAQRYRPVACRKNAR